MKNLETKNSDHNVRLSCVAATADLLPLGGGPVSRFS
jgi:hypothetical protein